VSNIPAVRFVECRGNESVIPRGARNLSGVFVQEKKERFLAPLGMRK
jgi:hypothetical protein